MDFDLPEELVRLRSAMRDYVLREVKPLVDATPRDEYGDLPEDLERKIRKRSVELGFYNLLMPEEFGGIDLNTLGLVLLREEHARHFPGFGEGAAMVAHSMDGPDRMWLKGTKEQIDKYLWPLVRGDATTCFGITEPGAGSDNQAMSTRAVRDGDDWVLNGMKHFISASHRADFCRIYAVTDPAKKARGGISCFVIDKGTPGLTVGRRQKTMGGSSPCEIYLEDCRLPGNSVLGEVGYAFYLGMEHLNGNRMGMAATCLGTAEFCLNGSVAYAKQRVTFGQPLAERQAVQWMLADMAVELAAARALTYTCAQSEDRKPGSARTEAGMCKLYASEMVGRAADSAIQIHGGIGYTTDLPYEKIYRGVRLFRIGEGGSEIMRILVARQLLKD